MGMKPEAAINELKELMRMAKEDESVRCTGPDHDTWKAKVDTVMVRSIGTESSTLAKFRDLRYHVGVWTGAPGEAAEDARYFAEQVDRAAGLIDAAIYELQLMSGEAAVEGASFDVELWQHVRHSIEEERWEQVASQAAIFVEDKVRRWAGRPTGSDGKLLFGQPLFAHALAEGAVLALGQQSNETTGWRNLGTGLVAALGNVDRHHIQERPDARQYSLGVLGLASLLLTQIRYEHPDVVAAAK
jgi:hypothetical protein